VIPQTFHRIWLGGPEPEWSAAFALTWAAHHPDWELKQWGEAEVEELFPLVNQRLYDEAERLAPRNVGQLRSDILRLEILARFGGVYVDADFECRRPIDSLLVDVECFAAWVDNDWINNAIMGAVPEHPFIMRLVAGLRRSAKRHIRFRPNVMTGPQYLTRAFKIAPDSTVKLFEPKLFYPFDWKALDHSVSEDFDGAYAVHWWANQRRERGVPAPS